MPSQQFPFVTDGIRGDVPTNFYPATDPEKKSILHGTPGLKELCDLTACTEVRGLFTYDTYMYAVARRGGESVLWRIDSSGGFSEVGTILTSTIGPVWITRNPTQLLIVDGVSGYVYTPGTGLMVQITDEDFPGAGTADYQDGYGLFTEPGTKRWFFSSIDDFLTFDALDFYSKEGKPDQVISILSDHREPWIFGTKSTEVWYNTGGDNTSAATATFARNQGGLIEFGCGAAKSPAQFDNSITWLSDQGQLMKAKGYSPVIISNDMFGLEISQYATFSDAIAFSYTENEHNFYQITFPTANKTWVYDAKTQIFHKRTSWQGVGEFGRHRANCYALLNNKHYVGDYENGKIYEMSLDYLDDAGNEIQRRVYSTEFYAGLKKHFFPSVQIEFEPGVGLESGLDPQAMLEFSNNGGKTWSNEIWRSVGKIGEYNRRAIWHRLGSAHRRIYRLTVSDPVLWRVLSVSWWGDK
jgi:hypothetical protein